jgi:ABC-type sugar transport system permease subunit
LELAPVTVLYTAVVTAVSIVAGLLLAAALNSRYLMLKGVWRGLYFLPSVTPTVAAAMVWMLVFNPGFGYVNVVLRQLGIDGAKLAGGSVLGPSDGHAARDLAPTRLQLHRLSGCLAGHSF